jgi:hypothetical protein
MSRRPAHIEVDVRERWDALDLLQRLVPFRSHLVERGPDHWRVHAQAPGYHGERLANALDTIEECLSERGVADAAVRVDGRLRDATSARASGRGGVRKSCARVGT